MEGELTCILLATIDIRSDVRNNAESRLIEASEGNLPLYVEALAGELCNNAAPIKSRQIAGLLLKNAFSAKDKREDELKGEKWLKLPQSLTDPLKKKILETIQTEDGDVSSAACQVVSKLAKIELPRNLWPDCLETLLNMVSGVNITSKTASLNCLGFLCEEMAEILEEKEQDLLEESQVNQILIAALQGMRDAVETVKIAATKTFYHALMFAEKNFENEAERTFIFQILQENCQHSSVEVRVRSFECLVQVVSEYYEYLPPYMDGLLTLTLSAIKCGPEEVSITAMEFWNTLCDEELSIINGESERQFRQIVSQALSVMLPALLESLLQMGEEEDDDDMENWSLAKSSAVCLSLFAQIVGNEVLQPTLLFVNNNFLHADWRRREAAMLAFGSILEGPSPEALAPLVTEVFPIICGSLEDKSEEVRDTSAWTIGRMFSLHAKALLPLISVQPFEGSPLALIINCLKDKPRVAVNICWIIHELADYLESLPAEAGQPDYIALVLDPLYFAVLETLVAALRRPDADEKNLREAAFNTLATLVRTVGPSCMQFMMTLHLHLLEELQQSCTVEKTPKTRNIQGLVCGCMQVLISRLQKEMLPMMSATLSCLHSILNVSPDEDMSEDALLCTSAAVNVIGADFEQWMDSFSPILINGLSRSSEVMVCRISIELVGDVSRALGPRFVPYCEPIMRQLHALLEDKNGDRTLKPVIMIALGDVALAIKGDFVPFYDYFMELLIQAAETRYEMGPVDNEEWTAYVEMLRDGVIQAFSGIIYGMRDGGKEDLLKPNVGKMLQLIALVLDNMKDGTDSNFRSAIALTGDLLTAFGSELVEYLKQMGLIEKIVSKAEGVDTDTPEGSDCQEKVLWLLQVTKFWKEN